VNGMRAPLATALGVALLAGILVAWTPHYWGVSVAVASISLVTAIWAFAAPPVDLPREMILVATLGAWGFLQLAFHSSVAPWLTTLSSITWVISAAAFFLGSQILRTHRNRRVFLDLMLWAITALAVAAMLQMYGTPGRVFGIFPAGPNVVGTLFYKNQFAALMELAAPIALWKVFNGKAVTGGLCFAAMFAATLTSSSRAGVALVLAELLVFLALMVFGRRLPLKSAASVVALLVLLAAGGSMVAGTARIWDRFQEHNPYALRRMLRDSTLQMVAERPWFGSGMGAWRSAYPRFATFDTAVFVNEAHNDWAQWASEGGIPFLLLMAALVIWLVQPSLQSIWGLGILSVMVHSYVDYPLREPVISCLWFTMAGALTRIHDVKST
jgi:O-antigen ligase